MSYLDGNGARTMTAGEIALARRFFGDSIDYDEVRIRRTYFSRPHVLAFANTIYLPEAFHAGDISAKGVSEMSTLLHELTHIWQGQHGRWPTVRAGTQQVLVSIWAGVVALVARTFTGRTISDVFGTRIFDVIYGGYKDAPVKAAFTDYSIENQGEIVQQYSAVVLRGTPPLNAYQQKAKEIVDHLGGMLKITGGV